MNEDLDKKNFPDNPFPGIEAFKYLERGVFFARDEDSQTLIRLVVMYRGVLLYSESGLGKSSLINAGLIHRAVNENFIPVKIRVHPKKDREFIIEHIISKREKGRDNVEFLSSIFPIKKGETRSALSIKNFLDCLENQVSLKKYPLLIFDQFEEWITLFEESIPGQSAAMTMSIKDSIKNAIISIINNNKLPVKILITIREDYLAKLTPFFNECPYLPDQALRLEPLKKEQIYNAIRGPFEEYPDIYKEGISKELAKLIIAQLEEKSGGFHINTTEVQIVCRKLMESGKKGNEVNVFFDKRNGVKGILVEYLESSLNSLSIEQRDPAIAILSKMVTAAGTRNVISKNDLIKRVENEDRMYLEEKIDSRLLTAVIENLDKKCKLIKKEPRRDVYYYEITSEFLIEWIQNKTQKYKQLIKEKELRKSREEAERKTKEAKEKIKAAKKVKILSVSLIVVSLILIVVIIYTNGYLKNANYYFSVTLAKQKDLKTKYDRLSIKFNDLEIKREELKDMVDKLKDRKEFFSEHIKEQEKIIAEKDKIIKTTQEKSSRLAQEMLWLMGKKQEKEDIVKYLIEELQGIYNNILDNKEIKITTKELINLSRWSVETDIKNYGEKAVKYLNLAISNKEITAEYKAFAYNLLGYIYYQKKDYSESIEHADKSIKIVSTNNGLKNGWSYIIKGYSYLKLGKCDESLDAFKKAINFNPAYYSYCGIAEVYIELEEYSEAIDNLKKAIKKDEKRDYAYQLYALIYETKQIDFKKAYEYRKKAYDVNSCLTNKYDFIISNITTQRYEEAQKLAFEILDDHKKYLDKDEYIEYLLNLKSAIIACKIFLSQTEGIKKDLKEFIEIYKEKTPKDYIPEFKYSGMKEYYKNIKINSTYIDLLFDMINLLEKPKSKANIVTLRKYLD